MVTNDEQYVEYFFAKALIDVEMRDGKLEWNGAERARIPEALEEKLKARYFDYTESQQDVRVDLVAGGEIVKRMAGARDGKYQVMVHMEYPAGVEPNSEGTHEELLTGMRKSAEAQIEDVLDLMSVPRERARISVEEVAYRP